MSPYVFLICNKGLLALPRLAKKDRLLTGVKDCRKCLLISHILFTDDCILFGKDTKRGIHILKEIIREYEVCTGKCINFDKYLLYFNLNVIDELLSTFLVS